MAPSRRVEIDPTMLKLKLALPFIGVALGLAPSRSCSEPRPVHRYPRRRRRSDAAARRGHPTDDVVYDLGCGDGRIPIAAARKYGARGVGLTSNPGARSTQAKANAKAAGVEALVEFRVAERPRRPTSPPPPSSRSSFSRRRTSKLRPMLTRQLEARRARSCRTRSAWGETGRLTRSINSSAHAATRSRCICGKLSKGIRDKG